MAEFTRRELKRIFEAADLEVPKDVITSLCELHTSSADGASESVRSLQQRLADAERERDEYKARVPMDGAETVDKAVYDKLNGEFEAYKKDVEAKETRAAKERAYRAILADAGLTDKGIEKAVKYADWDSMDQDGDSLKNPKELIKAAKEEWAEYVSTTVVRGANTATPPANNGGVTKKTKEEILAIKDPALRQAEIAKNPEAFGLNFN
jgi:hypothetical protein